MRLPHHPLTEKIIKSVKHLAKTLHNDHAHLPLLSEVEMRRDVLP